MITLVEERRFHDKDYRRSFFFDMSKVNYRVRFEAAYARIIKRALESSDKDAMPFSSVDMSHLSDRFDAYCDGRDLWTYLLAEQPCQVDGQVIVWLW